MRPKSHTMHKLISIAIVCALFGAWLSHSAKAQQPVRVCIPVYNATTGALSCVDGWLPKLLNGLSTTVTSVLSNSSGVLGTIYCYNPNASVAYIQIFDAATTASVTLNSTVPKLSLGIPTALASGTGPTAVGVEFQSGIQVAVTTTATGSTAPAQPLDCSVTYN